MASLQATMAASRLIQSGKASLQLLIYRHIRPYVAIAAYQFTDSSTPPLPKNWTNPIGLYSDLKTEENRSFQYPILNQTGASINRSSVEMEDIKDYYDSDDDSGDSDCNDFNGVDGFDDSENSASEVDDEEVNNRYRE